MTIFGQIEMLVVREFLAKKQPFLVKSSNLSFLTKIWPFWQKQFVKMHYLWYSLKVFKSRDVIVKVNISIPFNVLIMLT